MIKPAENCFTISSESDMELKYLEGNRDPQEHPDHIKKIAGAMGKHMHVPSIIVANYQGSHYIVDGQHRYEAAKLLWNKGVEYELLIETYNSINPFMEAVTFNNSKLDWGIITYLRGFAINKAPYYQEFLDWMAERDWARDKSKKDPYTIGLALLGVKNKAKLRNGVLQIGISFATAEKVYDLIKDAEVFPLIVKNEASAKAFYNRFLFNFSDLCDLISGFDPITPPPITNRIKDWTEYFESFL